jgi:ectoine hydroxylase-related dioxygenase (phytanoyl-CoA dioxygenase family)
LWLIPGSHWETQASHQKKQEASDSKYRAELEIRVDESKAIPIPMKAGECLFFHCWTLHKSEGNFSDLDRRILFLRYADADAVEVYNDRKPRLGRLLLGRTRFDDVRAFEADLQIRG